MIIPSVALVFGLFLLVWSADKFVEGTACTARYFNVSPLLIGMVVVGFGTSAPEMVVSAFAASQGNPGIALGNALGSNITNIGLVLGLTAIISPIAVQSQVLRKELPLLTAVTALLALLLYDGHLARHDAVILLCVFAALMGWTVVQAVHDGTDALGKEVDDCLREETGSIRQSVFRLIIGLILLIVSSRILVWGAVEIAHNLGVSDLIIGLTVIAIGTSLPELASSLVATRRGEHDLALGNVLGSNLFNSLAVVGIAGAIHPLDVEPRIFTRDIMVMTAMTISLFIFGYGFKGPGRINRYEGGILLLTYTAYTAHLVRSIIQA